MSFFGNAANAQTANARLTLANLAASLRSASANNASLSACQSTKIKIKIKTIDKKHRIDSLRRLPTQFQLRFSVIQQCVPIIQSKIFKIFKISKKINNTLNRLSSAAHLRRNAVS